MRIGLGLPNTVAGTTGEALLEWIRKAEDGPFSSIAVFDRLRYDSLEPLSVLSAAAAITHRIRLATLIVAAPLRNAAALAKTAASVHALSGGRLILGLAVGAREEDYQAAQVSYGGRGARFTEHLETMLNLWDDPDFGPRLPQPGGPLLLIGGASDPSFNRMARYSQGYVHGGGPPRAFARAADKARAAWEDFGRPGLPALWGMGYFALGEAAAEAGENYLRHYYAFTGPFAERIAQQLLRTPQQIAQFAGGYADAGCDELVLFPTSFDPTELDRLIEVVQELQ